MGSFISTCPDPRNLTCHPEDNITLRNQIEHECRVYMVILIGVALVTGCLLVVTVRIVNKYWYSSPITAHRRIAQRRPSLSDHYVTSMIGGAVSTRTHTQGQNLV